MAYDFNNFKNDKVSKPRNMAWGNWFTFTNVGDKVQGYIRDVFYKPAEAQFKEARGLTLEQQDGTLINVQIKTLPFVLKDTDEFHLGDPITIELTDLKKGATAGFAPAKILTFYGAQLPENADKPTVKVLYAEDMNAGGSIAPEAAADKAADAELDAFGKPQVA